MDELTFFLPFPCTVKGKLTRELVRHVQYIHAKPKLGILIFPCFW